MALAFTETDDSFGCGDYIQVRGSRLFMRTNADSTAAVGMASGTGLPSELADFTDASYTYTQIGRIDSLGEIGGEASVGSFSPIDSPYVCKSMGPTDLGSFEFTVAKTSDKGVKCLTAVQGNTEAYQFIIVGSNDTTLAAAVAPTKAVYFNALVPKAKDSYSEADGIVKVACSLVIMGKPLNNLI